MVCVNMEMDINKKEIQDKLRKKIKELMKMKGYKQKDLVEKSGLTQVYISYFLTGKRNIGFDALNKIAQALGVSVAELLETRDEKEPPRLEHFAKKVKLLPIITAIRAGAPNQIEFKYEDKYYPYVGEDCDDCIVLEVEGDSMYPTLNEGDYIAVRPIEKYPMLIPENFENKVVVAANENWEYTIKRIKKINNKWYLVPDNPKYEILDADGWHLVGVARKRLPKPEEL